MYCDKAKEKEYFSIKLGKKRKKKKLNIFYMICIEKHAILFQNFSSKS